MAEKLNADLNIIQRSGIEITVDPITADLNIIQKLDDEPNDVGGLSAAELKAKFDEAGNIIKEFINGSLIPQVVGADAVEQVREENEAARVAAETAREQAEAARAAAETEREENETARVAAETARETAFAAAQAERAAAFDEAQASRAAVFSAGEEARNFWDDYDPTKDYVPGNKVYYLGSSYVNKVPCRDVLPTVEDNWQMIAKKGADSDEGLSQEEADLRYLQLTGGRMTGALEVLEPEKGAQPATKHYTDTCDASTLSAAKRYADGKVGQYGYSKEETLKAETAALLGLPADAVPDDAFLKLSAGAGMYLYKIHVVLPDGSPVDGATVSGIESLPNRDLVTDPNGDVIGSSDSAEVSVSVNSDMIDLLNVSGQSVSSDGIITTATVVLPHNTGMVSITSSKTCRHSSAVDSMDFCAAGGGGGGGGGSIYKYNSYRYFNGGGGGGGGHLASVFAVKPSASCQFRVVIGSGGSAGTTPTVAAVSAGTSGGSGGATSVALDGVTILSASGGGGGTSSTSGGTGGSGGSGRGGNGGVYPESGGNGTNSAKYPFDDTTTYLLGGGGGGGTGGQSGSEAYPGGKGGSPGGGRGAGGDGAAVQGSNCGGGDGGGLTTVVANGARGGSGRVIVIFHHKEAS